MFKRAWNWCLGKSLWIMSIGLMLASSGIDGAYMSQWMPRQAYWLGYILNTTSDVASEVLMYWFARLRQERKGSKRWRMALWILPAVALIVLYSWFFSWRQLRVVMASFEGPSTEWVSIVSAGFVPLVLVATGYAQAIKDGRFEEREESKEGPQETQETPEETVETPVKSEETPVKPKVDLSSMSKAERILHLNNSQPKLTQSEIAVKADCSDSYVSKVLSSHLTSKDNGV